jgi:hypothetical protein
VQEWGAKSESWFSAGTSWYIDVSGSHRELVTSTWWYAEGSLTVHCSHHHSNIAPQGMGWHRRAGNHLCCHRSNGPVVHLPYAKQAYLCTGTVNSGFCSPRAGTVSSSVAWHAREVVNDGWDSLEVLPT